MTFWSSLFGTESVYEQSKVTSSEEGLYLIPHMNVSQIDDIGGNQTYGFSGLHHIPAVKYTADMPEGHEFVFYMKKRSVKEGSELDVIRKTSRFFGVPVRKYTVLDKNGNELHVISAFEKIKT